MKRIIYLPLLLLLLAACTDTKKQEKAVQKEILDFHDQVMGDDEKAMIDKMKLDTIIHIADSLKTDKTVPAALRSKLVLADNKMSDWMSGFTLDYTGKTHEEIMKYLQEQKSQIKMVDSLLVDATKGSSAYLKTKK